MKIFPACIPDGLCAQDRHNPLVPRAADLRPARQRMGSIPERDMFNTFNMGVGMSDDRRGEDDADKARCRSSSENGEDAYVIGEVVERGREGRTMLKSARIAVFVSGGGTNLQALARRTGSRQRFHSGEIVARHVGSQGLCASSALRTRGRKGERPRARRAVRASFSTTLRRRIELLLEQYRDRRHRPRRLFEHPERERSRKSGPRRILNIHPSLIPSFCGRGMYGLKVHEAALARGVKVTGATVHFVNEIPDGGRDSCCKRRSRSKQGDTPRDACSAA